MSLISKDSLEAFLGANNFLVKETEPAGFTEGVAMAEGIVFGKIGIAEADISTTATQLISFCAHAIFIYVTSFRQTLKQDEKDRVKNLYDEAIKFLDDISSGEIKVVDSPSEDTTLGNAFYVNSSTRSERF